MPSFCRRTGRSQKSTLKILFAVALVFSAFHCYKAPNVEPPKITAGFLDLSQWDFKKNPLVSLAGEWQVTTPQKNARPQFNTTDLIQLPSNWLDARHGGRFLRHGILAYRSRVKLPPGKRTLSLNIPLIYCAYELYINGALFAGRGRVGYSRSEEEFAAKNLYVILPHDLTELEIVIIHSAHNFRQGSFDTALQIGTTEFIANRSGERTMADSNFLNSYLKRMSPIIETHGGFIDKFIGDAIMALFPREGQDGVEAAVGMVTELQVYNRHRENQGYAPVDIGVGLHTGKLILGTIGSADRMDGTVISDSVNLASRIEGLTKFYGANIVISETTFATLSDPTRYHYRVLDQVVVKGKQEAVTVFEIFNGQSEVRIDRALRTKGNFERGINYYMMQDFDAAEASFRLVLMDAPDDKAAAIYLKRSEHYAAHGAPPDWSSVEVLETK